MITILIYTISTGEFSRQVSSPSSMVDAQIHTGEAYIVGESYALDTYVVNGVIVDRPSMSPTVTGLTLTNLPIPCMVTTYGKTVEILDGDVTITYDLAGTYKVKVTAFPYMDWEVDLVSN